jgi:hypothetical protein
MTIWKYPLTLTDVQDVRMPSGSEILTVQVQHASLCLWALVNQNAGRDAGEVRTIEIHGTGIIMSDEERRYIGTAQMAGGALVWHVFERL